MSHVRLSNTDDWQLKFPDDQDLRGYRALNQDGTDLGTTVSDMIVDTDDKRVSTIVLSDGTEYPARDISIGEGVVYVTGRYPVNDTKARRTADIEDFGIVIART